MDVTGNVQICCGTRLLNSASAVQFLADATAGVKWQGKKCHTQYLIYDTVPAPCGTRANGR